MARKPRKTTRPAVQRTIRRPRNVTIPHLSWTPIDTTNIGKKTVRVWQCSEYPGLVLTWVGERVDSCQNFEFSGFTEASLKKEIKELLKKYDVEDSKIKKVTSAKKRIRL